MGCFDLCLKLFRFVEQLLCFGGVFGFRFNSLRFRVLFWGVLWQYGCFFDFVLSCECFECVFKDLMRFGCFVNAFCIFFNF